MNHEEKLTAGADAAASHCSAFLFAAYFASIMVLLMAFTVWRLTRLESAEKDSFDVIASEVKQWLRLGGRK